MNTGYIQLTNTHDTTDWALKNDNGDILQNGCFHPAINIENEFFNFEEATQRVAKASGYDITNDERYTESIDNSLYWTVAFTQQVN